MAEQRRDEKQDEKEEEKRSEKQEKEGQSWEEKWRRDPLGSIVWALILIWAGVVFLADNLGLLGGLRRTGWGDGRGALLAIGAWDVILMGAGIILLLEVAVRLAIPAYRRPVMGTLILAAVLIGIGLGNLFGWTVVGPLVLIAIGVGILLRGSSRR